MPPKDNKQKDKVLNDSSLNQYINADHFGIDTSRFNKHERILNQLDESVRKIFVESNKRMNSSTSSMDKMFRMLKQTMTDGRSVLNQYNAILKNQHTSSGIRTLGDLTTHPEELKLVDMYEQNIRNSFIQMNEFRIICKIVPELRKIVENVTRDILNTNDIDKHFIKNLYNKSNINGLTDSEIESINKEIDEKIVKRHTLEDKVKQYIQEALITGAKPIAVIPYKDIYEMIYNKMDELKSNKSTEDFVQDIKKSDKYFYPKISDIFMKAHNHNKTLESYPNFDATDLDSNVDIYDDILGNSVEDLFKIEAREYIANIHETNKYDKSLEELVKETENEDEKKEIEDAMNFINDFNTNKDSDVIKVKKNSLKKELLRIVDIIDNNLEIIDPTNTAIKMASTSLKQNWKFKKLHDNLLNIEVNPDLSRRDNTILDKFDKGVYETDDDLVDRYKDKDIDKKPKKDKMTKEDDEFLNDVLIVDYDPENVIPIIVNGIHVDYYVLEEEAYNGGFDRNRKVGFSFMDIISSLGIANDDAVTGTGMQNMATDGMGFANTPAFGQQINIASVSSSFTLQAQTDDAIRRNDILREIVLRTISTKMKDKDMVENKVFRDCIMNLLRQGYILKKKVQFTNIPAGNMIYFTHNLSNTGLPKSIYSDTLFYCYIYISSLVSSLMIKLAKSSNKDKITFEVGRDTNAALAAHLIDNGLSTRQTHGYETFQSVRSVLKNSAAHDRILIPSYGGNRLLEYEEMNKMNDIDIDDDFTEKMLQKIVQQTDYPAAAMNKLSEEEYSRSVVAQQIMYINSLKEMQDAFGAQVSKLIKLCIRYTKFSEINERKIKDNIDEIDFSFAIPKDLYLVNSKESFSNIEEYADMITKLYFNERMDDEAWKTAVDKFKLEVVKTNATNIEWDDYQTLYDQILAEKPKMELEKIKNTKLFELLQEKAMGGNEEDDMGMGGDFGSTDDTGFGDDMGGGFGEEQPQDMGSDFTPPEEEPLEF